MGKTLSSLFSAFGKEELCQLYIYPSFPDIDRCHSYFRITDKDILKSFSRFSAPGAEIDKDVINPDQPPFERDQDERFYRNAKNKTAARRLARDAMWRMSRWYRKELRDWIDREKPDVLFVAPGPACFLYAMATKISRQYKLPLVSYICDEYYFIKTEKSITGLAQQKVLQKTIRSYMKKNAGLITISEELKAAYEETFRVQSDVLMTGSTIKGSAVGAADQPADCMCYFGNVRSGRYQSLRQIGEALDVYNVSCGQQHYLDIYSFERDPQILSYLTVPKSVRFHGFVQGKAFEEAFLSSKLLVHAESFDPAMIDRVKHSVSTKLADSLSSGIPLLCYGPKGLASVEHLRRNDCAFVCTDHAALLETVQRAISDVPARQKIAASALQSAHLFHDSLKNSQKLHQILQKISGDNL